jgi:selenocysteine lyase/cysteine desulfurase
VAALSGAGVYVGVRGDVVRVSPHVHNDSRDIDRLLEVLQSRVESA